MQSFVYIFRFTFALGLSNLSSFLYQRSESFHYCRRIGFFDKSSLGGRIEKLLGRKLFGGGKSSFLFLKTTEGVLILLSSSSEKGALSYLVWYHLIYWVVYPSNYLDLRYILNLVGSHNNSLISWILALSKSWTTYICLIKSSI